MQIRPFEEWIEKEYQRDDNLCGACARPTDKSSLMSGGGGYNQGSCVYFAKRCGGWVFAGVDGVLGVDVEGSSILSSYWGEAQRHVPDRHFIAKTEMAMRCRGDGRREIGVKCGCMQGCCVGARLGVRSWRSMVRVAASTKTNRVGAVTRKS